MIPVCSVNIDTDEVFAIKASDLYRALHLNVAYEEWLPKVIEKSGFAFEVDYTHKEIDFDPSADVWFTLGASKRVAMDSLHQKGREIRDYIIAFEKQHMRPKEA